MSDGMEIIERAPSALSTPATPMQQLATTPMELLSMVTARGASIEEISKFMDLMERQQANEARQAFVRAMAAFKRNPPDIYKDKNVEHSGISYDHATLGNICEVVIGALAQHGISHAWKVEQPPSGLITVSCALTHDMGHSESTTISAPADNSGKKNPIQSIGSAITYCQRYTLLAACGIAVKEAIDDDGRGATPEPVEKPIVRESIAGNAFVKAVASVKAGTYTTAEIRKYYALTTDQETVLLDLEKALKS